MSFEGGLSGSLCRGAESGDTEPPPSPPPPPPPPPGEPASVPAPPRYLPPLPAPPASAERAAGPDEPPTEVVPRRRGADELPPPPAPLPPAGQEVSAAGDSGEGPRRLPEAAVPEAAAAGKGVPGEPEAGAGGEGERRGAGDQPETRSVCSSRSSSSGGGDQRAGHQHQHHQPICKICFQGAEQVRPCGTSEQLAVGSGQDWTGSCPGRSTFQHHGQRSPSAFLAIPACLSGQLSCYLCSLFPFSEGR